MTDTSIEPRSTSGPKSNRPTRTRIVRAWLVFGVVVNVLVLFGGAFPALDCVAGESLYAVSSSLPWGLLTAIDEVRSTGWGPCAPSAPSLASVALALGPTLNALAFGFVHSRLVVPYGARVSFGLAACAFVLAAMVALAATL
jgi:hypothetical protein